MSFRKWYFAVNANALEHGFDQVQVAVLSNKDRAGLQPICLVDNVSVTERHGEHLDWLRQHDVELHRRDRTLFAAAQSAHENADVFSGHWLRLDIPLIEQSDAFVLYTDIDVIFLKDPASLQMRPPFLAASPEHEQTDFSYFNSGVLILNIASVRTRHDALSQLVWDRPGTRAPHDDQGILNAVFRHEWTRLPNAYNWKPYWGIAPDAGIVHFVGPKPAHIRRMQSGPADVFGADYEALYRRDPAAYRHYVEVFDRYLARA